MFTFSVKNVSEALYVVNQSLRLNGVNRETRNGPAIEFPGPVAITYKKPKERVLFYPERDANPFFHFMESLWMLAGHRDVKFVQQYNSNMSVYSDNGIYFHGAYGYRWRNWFEKDQLKTLIHRLKTYPNDRRCVLNMWDPNADLVEGNQNVDIPCNTHIYFRLEEGKRNQKSKIHMTVCNRSNDMIWGALGANVVHMSFLQEYIAAMVGAEVGTYVQFSNNFHAYLETLSKIENLTPDYEPYLQIEEKAGRKYGSAVFANPVDLVTDVDLFDQELHHFMDNRQYIGSNQKVHYVNQIFSEVAEPMCEAWEFWEKHKRLNISHPESVTSEIALSHALSAARKIKAPDWRVACYEWLDRRKEAKYELKYNIFNEEWGCSNAQRPSRKKEE
jgi:thymidylate synthase